MIIDNFTIILSCAIIVVALLTSVLTNPFFRKFCEREMGNTDVADNDGNEKETAGDKPKVSVVIISNGTAEQMDQHLPVLLTQDYAPGYEVLWWQSRATPQPKMCSSATLQTHISTPRLCQADRSS